MIELWDTEVIRRNTNQFDWFRVLYNVHVDKKKLPISPK